MMQILTLITLCSQIVGIVHMQFGLFIPACLIILANTCASDVTVLSTWARDHLALIAHLHIVYHVTCLYESEEQLSHVVC